MHFALVRRNVSRVDIHFVGELLNKAYSLGAQPNLHIYYWLSTTANFSLHKMNCDHEALVSEIQVT